MTRALEVSDLHVSYGGIKAVRGISFAVDEGQIVTLIGANGAGKSSSLRAVLRTVKSTGAIRAFDTDLTRLETHHIAGLGIAMVPEGRAIFGNLTVRENLEMGAWVRRRDAAGRKARLEEVVALFPRLGERMKQHGGTLSGGEQQMLAIGRALMSGPRLMLLDEPSLGLAPKLVKEIFAAIRRIAEGGISVLLVEQNTRLALETAQYAYVLVTGEVAFHGTAAELREDHRIRDAYLGEAVVE